MYAGRVVEEGKTEDLFARPRHPYTRALLHALPSLSTTGRLQTIPGSVPDLSNLPRGCAYQDRCERVEARCRSEEPALERGARCFYPYGDS
jgi:oligopeptide/dipeptide ABC transporter ATP-binding protein